jgi:hypothetical protein
MLDTVTNPRIINLTTLHRLHPLRNRRVFILHHLLQSHMLLALIRTHHSVLHLCTAVMERQYPVQVLQDPDMRNHFLQLSNTTRHLRPMQDRWCLRRATYRHGVLGNRRHLEYPRIPVWDNSNNPHQANRVITVRGLNHNKAFKNVPLPPSKGNIPSQPMCPHTVNLDHYKCHLFLHMLL